MTDRGDASGTGYWSPTPGTYADQVLSIIDSSRDWSDVLPTVLGPLDSAGEWRGAVVGPGTGDNMAAAMGVGLAHRRRGDLGRHLRYGVRRLRHADRRLRPVTSPGSPTPPVGSCRSSAR